jgi:hypothetical protein
MKTKVLFLFSTLILNFSFGQSLPSKPSFSQVVAAMKKDSDLKESFEKRGIPFNRVKFEAVNPSNHVDQVFHGNKKRVDMVYNDRTNILQDALKHFVMAEIPKDVYGASYRIPLEVVFHRLERDGKDYKFYKSWQYSYTLLETNHVVIPKDAPKISNDEKIEKVKGFIKRLEAEGGKFLGAETFGNVVSVHDIKYIPNNREYEKVGGINRMKWSIAFLIERGQDRMELTTDKTQKEYIVTDINVELVKGKYNILGLDRVSILDKYNTTYSWNSVIDQVEFDPVDLASPVAYGNWYDNGFEAVFKKYAEKTHAPCSKKYIIDALKSFEEELKKADFNQGTFSDDLKPFFADEAVFENFKREVLEERNIEGDILATQIKKDEDVRYGTINSNGVNIALSENQINIDFKYIEKKEVRTKKSLIIFSYYKNEIQETEKSRKIGIGLEWSCENEGDFKINEFSVFNR